jgi:alpha-N-arabinofuranosidase
VRTKSGNSFVLASAKIDSNKPLSLQVSAKGDDYNFNYAQDGKNFQNLGRTVSGDILSTNVAGGFTGAMIGLYATKANDIRF